MDYQEIRKKAIEFMQGRNWKQKTGKLKHFNQSLFDHSLVVLDAMIALLPLLRATFVPPFTEEEEQVLLAGVIAHDVGKELDDWQAYVHGQRGFLSDVDRQLADEVVPQLCAIFGFTGIKETLSGVLLHMNHERTPAKVMERMLFVKHDNERWKTLGDVIAEVDNLGSAKGVFQGLQCLDERSCFSRHIRASYHLVQVRGVSTTLLHRAALDAFVAKGWSPVLHYSDGTIYAASAASEVSEPTVTEIEERLTANVQETMGSKFAQQVVGNPVKTLLPKPELFDHREVHQYLEVAATRVSTKTFARKKDDEKIEKASQYLKLLGAESPSQKQLFEQADRIARAYPEMSVFAFFKAMLKEGLLGNQDSSLLKEAYESAFGKGTFDKFKSSSAQLSVVGHLEKVIDPFWQLAGERFGLDLQKVEFAPDTTRQRLLVNELSEIAAKVYAEMSETDRPSRAAPELIANCFIADLIHPARHLNLINLVAQQLQAYAVTKANARRDKGAHLCPICNLMFEGGTVAKDDFLAKPDAHTNRAVSHGVAGYIVICDACKYERFLQQLLLGNKVEEVLVLFPRMNIGPGSGAALQRKAHQLWDAALNRMAETNPDPDEHVSLALTYNVARKLSDLDVFRLSAEEIAELLTYKSSEKTQKEHRKNLADGLKQLYETDELSVEMLNGHWDRDYTTVDEALQALIENQVTDDGARKVRAAAFRLMPQLHIACQTPHLILVPLTNPIAMSKESDTNAGIRELYVTLLLGLALDCSVAVMQTGEVITFAGGEGVARVPPIPALRALIGARKAQAFQENQEWVPSVPALIGAEWIPVADAKRWLDAIGAAALLANATAFPESSNLYAILKSPTAGHIMRRIEQQEEKRKREGKPPFSLEQRKEHFTLLETIKEVLR